MRGAVAAVLPGTGAAADGMLSIDQLAAFFRIMALHRLARRADAVIGDVASKGAAADTGAQDRARLLRIGEALGWLRHALPESTGVLAQRLEQAERILGRRDARPDFADFDEAVAAITHQLDLPS